MVACTVEPTSSRDDDFHTDDELEILEHIEGLVRRLDDVAADEAPDNLILYPRRCGHLSRHARAGRHPPNGRRPHGR